MKEKQDKDIDNLFKRGLEDPVDQTGFMEDDWNALEQMLDKGKKRRGIVFWLPVLSAVAALLLLFFGWWMFRPQVTDHQQKPQPQVTINRQPKQIKRDRLNGHLHHYSVKDMTECNSKAVHYAMLSAEKYFKAGKRANAVNLYISPIFSFIKSYILFLGFLDGKEGLNIAKMTYKNKWLKYHYLNSMENNSKKKQFVKANLVVEY